MLRCLAAARPRSIVHPGTDPSRLTCGERLRVRALWPRKTELLAR
jgi:hypothetical protein